MNILNAPEQEAYDAPPELSSGERKACFHLPHGLAGVAEALRSPTNQVCFVLACGYFRATKRFFTKDPRPKDLDYVCSKLGIQPGEVSPAAYHRATAMRHRRLILAHYGFREFDRVHSSIKTEIETMVRPQLKPRLIFYRAVDILIEQKMALPSSDALSKLILDVLNHRRKELVTIIERSLSAETRALLDRLLDKATSEGDEPVNRFRLTLLKRCSQSTRPGKIRESVDDLKLIRDLQGKMRPVLEKLGLPRDGISYYAKLL